MLEFYLYRFRVHPAAQGDLFTGERTRPEILREVLASVPAGEFRRGIIWHVGNVKSLDDTSLYFRIGRTTRSTIEVYEHGEFIDAEFESAPYTHAIIDLNLEVCAIAKKSRLSPRTKGIANSLLRLLNEAPVTPSLNAKFELGEINDPEDFIAYLNKSYAVTKFWMSFSKPNAIDVEKDYTLPMERLLQESDGDSGRTELKGPNLKPDTLEKLARSAAAAGENAGASMKQDPKAKPMKKVLAGNPAMVLHEEVAEYDDRRQLLQKIRQLYSKIRKSDQAK